MANFSDWSTTPSSNTAVGSVNIAEGAPPGNMNDAVREVMAACRSHYDSAADGSLYVTLASSVLSTNAIISGRGAIMSHNNAANTSGKIFVQAAGGAAPTMANGDFLFEY